MRSSSLLFLLLSAACTPSEGREAGECSDAADNDGDGLYDCDDPDCAGSPDCDEADTDTDADGDTDTDADADGDADTDTAEPSCEISIEETRPRDGAADAYYRADIEFWLDDAIPGAPSISLEGPAGVVAGSTLLSEDRELVWFEPSAPLAPLSRYTATLAYCGSGRASVSFTTSELGQPCTVSLEGRSYVLDLGDARFLEPAGIGELIGEFMTNEGVLGVADERGSSLDLIVGMSEEGSRPAVQDLCTQTLDSTCTWDRAPFFEYGPVDTTYTSAGTSFTIMDLHLAGTFAPDGSWLGGGEIALVLDMREWVDLIEEVESAADMCNLSASFGAPCQACQDGAEYCLPLLVDGILGEESSGTSVESVPASGHPECDGTTSCMGCASGGRLLPTTRAMLLACLALLGLRRRQG